MKNIKYLILISVVCIMVTNLKAQTDDAFKNKKIAIAWEPLHLIDGGIGVDFEMRLKETRNWLNLRLTGYYLPSYSPDSDNYEDYMTSSSGFEEFDGYSGFGAKATYKSFFSRSAFYWGGGLSYNYYDVSYYTQSYRSYKEDGMTFYKYYQGKESQHFNKIYPFLTIGARSAWRKQFVSEIYVTAGYSHGFYNEQKKAYNRNFLGFGHRGMAMTLGWRMGFQF